MAFFHSSEAKVKIKDLKKFKYGFDFSSPHGKFDFFPYVKVKVMLFLQYTLPKVFIDK